MWNIPIWNFDNLSIAIFIHPYFLWRAIYSLINERRAILRTRWYVRCIMEKNEFKIRKFSPIVETIWGVLIFVSSIVLLFIGG